MRPEYEYWDHVFNDMTSQRFTLIAKDWSRWFDNQKSFLAPLVIFYLVFVISQVQHEGIAPSDFIPSNAVISAMALYVLNAAYDLLRKWSTEKKY